MELTRRDAMTALAAAGASLGAGAATIRLDAHREDGLDEGDVEALAALAEVLYPSAAESVPAFVERYVRGRIHSRPDYAEGVRDAIATLDRSAQNFHDRSFTDLPPDTRRRLLSEASVDVADPDPEGMDHERIRHFLVNELLFAFYASPTGGRLAGIENPPGHPGGLAPYQRGAPNG